MHPDVEPFAKAYADLQAKFFEIDRQLQESNRNLFARERIGEFDYAASEAHTRLFNDWSALFNALEDAAVKLQEEALKAAGWPAEHPFVQHYRKRRAEIDRKKRESFRV